MPHSLTDYKIYILPDVPRESLNSTHILGLNALWYSKIYSINIDFCTGMASLRVIKIAECV